MTRLLPASLLVLLLVSSSPSLAQTNSNPGSGQRFVPATAQAAPQAAQQPGQPTGDIRPIVQPGAPGPAAQAPIAPPMPQQPEWAARMTAEEQKWIDDVLHYWEKRSDSVKSFECKFQKWDYDGGFVDATQKRHPRMFAEGAIKYAQPDKGLFHVEKLVAVMPPATPGQPPQQIVQNAELGEHWVCDGAKIFSFEANKKQMTVTPLPPEMRGKAISDGPLPFMFGARAQLIQARYWIHGLPNGPAEKYWLEAVPKSRQDAQNFKQVRIVLDQKDYLPESLEIFAPNYDPPRNDARQTYVFSNRTAKDAASFTDAIAKLFLREFYEPTLPLGWKKVVQNDAGNAVAGPPPQQAGPAPPPRQPESKSR